MDPVAKRRYFQQLAGAWDELPRPDDAPARIRRFLERALPPAPSRVLDVGCGTGVLLDELLRQCPPRTRIVELDFAWEMLAVNARARSDPRALPICADVHALPFTGKTFDVVLCFNVLPHLGDAQAAVARLLDVLAPQGILAVGHLMSSAELNAFHAQLEGPVSGDRLLLVHEFAERIAPLGLQVLCAEEGPGWYFLRAVKSSGAEG